MTNLENFYLNQQEPNKGTYLTLRDIILNLDSNITHSLKYGMPFFSYKKKMFCYFWKDKKTNEPYIGLVEGNRIKHISLEKGNRSRMKILRINPAKDIPIKTVTIILNEALYFYRKGIITS